MKKYLWIIALSGLAIINAAYLSYKAYYFRYIGGLAFDSPCDINSTMSCTEVLKHPLANVFGIPFPWIALVVYPVLLGLAVWGYKKRNYRAAKIIQVLSAMGMMFNAFIIYREVVYIRAYCILCLMCTAIIVSIFAISTYMLKARK